MNAEVCVHPRGPPRSASSRLGAAVGTDTVPLLLPRHCRARGAERGTLHASERPDSSWAGPGHTVVSGGRTDSKPFPEWLEGAAGREPDSVDLG